MKQSKEIYYTKYIENNWNNIKNNWKGIKTIISIKHITTKYLKFNSRTITALSKIFDNYFTSIAKKTNSNINFSLKHYTD